jgi:hypothetical protein
LQSNDIFKVGHIIHFKLLCPFDSFHSREDNSTTVFFCGIALNKAKSHWINRDVIQIIRPAMLAAIWAGSAQRISFFTPEREV